MKLGYVYHEDAADPMVQSCGPSSILEGLEAFSGVEVVRIFPLAARQGRFTILRKVAARLGGRITRGDRAPSYVQALGDEVTRRVLEAEVDVVFCPGSEAVTAMGGRIPLTFCADATFANMIDYYWDYTGITASYRRQGHAQERRALERCGLAVYPSQWAARSAIEDYGADPDQVAVIPWGANFGRRNAVSDVEHWIAERSDSDRFRVLFVGRNWERKGGDCVVETVRALRRAGLDVSLDVVGCEPPSRIERFGWMRTHGLLSAGRPVEADQLSELFRKAHLVFVPSRAEAYGMIFAEAGAFGVPAVATETGGIPGVVRDGHNGRLLPLEAGPVAFAEVIGRLLGDRRAYAAMAERALEEFATRLNWTAFCGAYLARVEALLVGGPTPTLAREAVAFC